MNHTTLEIFKTVAQERSVTRAAKRLGEPSPISPPAFTSWKRSWAWSCLPAAIKGCCCPPPVNIFGLRAENPQPGRRGQTGAASGDAGRQFTHGGDGRHRRQPPAAAASPVSRAVPGGDAHPQNPAHPSADPTGAGRRAGLRAGEPAAGNASAR